MGGEVGARTRPRQLREEQTGDARREAGRHTRPVGEVRPYPYASFRAIRRSEAARTNALLRRLPRVEAHAAREAIASLLGAPCALELGLPFVALPRTTGLAPPSVFVRMRPASPERRPILLEIDALLAASVLDRVLGGEGKTAPFSMAPTDVETGILLYFFGRVLAASNAPSFRIEALSTRPAEAFEALGDGAQLVLPIRVRVGSQEGTVQIWAHEHDVQRLPVVAPPDLPASLANLPISLAIVLGRATLPASALAGVAVGDALVLDRASVQVEGGSWTGTAQIRAPGGTGAFVAALEGDGLRILSFEAPSSPMLRGRSMNEIDETRRGIERMRDAPIELTVELGRFAMPLEELGALRPGEIVATGHRIGALVTLRVGDRVFATGELVDLEGEVAVRIVRLTGEPPAP